MHSYYDTLARVLQRKYWQENTHTHTHAHFYLVPAPVRRNIANFPVQAARLCAQLTFPLSVCMHAIYARARTPEKCFIVAEYII